MSRISEIQLGQLLTLLEMGYNQRQAAEKLGLNQSTVSRTLARYAERGSLMHLGGNGRPPVVSDEIASIIEAQRKQNPRTSLRKYQTLVQRTCGEKVAIATIRTWLNNREIFAYYPISKPLLKPCHVVSRFEHSKMWMCLANEEIKRVVFSDESKFNLFYNDGKSFVWCSSDSRLQMEHVNPTVKFSGESVMVWACFSYQGAGELVFIDGKMNAAGYISLLTEYLPLSVEKMGLSAFIYQHDNGPQHTSHLARYFFQQRSIETLPWPAQSPDMNPIENLWAIVKERVALLRPKNKAELKEAIVKAWNEIPVEMHQKLALSFKKRVVKLYNARGRYIDN